MLFFDNLFGPRYDSAIMSPGKLTKGTVQASLNEIFLLDKETSKGKRPVFIADKDNLANPQIKAYSDESNFIYSNC